MSIAPFDFETHGDGGIAAVDSALSFKHGAKSYKFQINATTSEAHYSQLFAGSPTSDMGGPSDNFMGGYYSAWLRVAQGYTQTGWNMWLGWMTGVSGAPSPICNVGLEIWGGVLQTIVNFTNASGSEGFYTAPAIAGYTLASDGHYRMSGSSPQGIVAFPRGPYVHLEVLYVMAAASGRLAIWQSGIKTMDLAHADLNTFHGGSTAGPNPPGTNVAGDMKLQVGIYGGAKSEPGGIAQLFMDDFRVSDQRLGPV